MTGRAGTLDVAVYGIVNAGKSSLINALVRRDERSASPIGGTTDSVAEVDWTVVPASPADDAKGSPAPAPPRGEGRGEGGRDLTDPLCYAVRLIDTPGLEEVEGEGRGDLATEAARAADLVLFVMAEDLTATARRALVALRGAGKPILVVVNKVDLLDDGDREAIVAAIRSGLDGVIAPGDVIEAAASPIVRQRVASAGGGTRVEAIRGASEVGGLEARLLGALAESAGDLKALAGLSEEVAGFVVARDERKAQLRERATRVADETSAALAVALAVNPVPLLDFLAGPGGLAVLVRRVSAVYGEPLSAEVARGLAADLVRGGRVVLWGSLAATLVGGAFKIVPGLGHLAGAITQGVSAGYFGHVVGRALVDYLENGRDWGDGGLVAALDRVAASTDRKALTKGLIGQIKGRLRGVRP